MLVSLHSEKLTAILKDFYTLTGIRITIRDSENNIIFSYPDEDSPFCKFMRKNDEFNKKCLECDAGGFARCDKSEKTEIYKCHAGLSEVISPIKENDKIIGYILIGQITDNMNHFEVLSKQNELIEKYFPDTPPQNFVRKIKYKSPKEIAAAAKILDALARYILLEEMIQLSERDIFDKIAQYIDSHIKEDITVSMLCKEFGICRTKLYTIVDENTGMGVASYIRKCRLKKAKHLIKTTDLKITEISDEIGFSDYNYFLRSFKKEFGISPKKLSLKKNMSLRKENS